jgi:hypothetical protein
MAKATHSGTCQICGSLQKLPGGVLSKHGYTTRFGFFEGVCSGSGSLPFELSCDLIEDSIALQRKTALERRHQAADYRAEPWGETHNVVKLRVYDGRRTHYSNPGYVWVNATITAETKTSRHDDDSWLEFTATFRLLNADKDTTQRVDAYGAAYPRTLATVLAYEADKWAKSLEQQASQREEYANWQQERIRNWKAEPSKLVPVKA